MLHRIVDNKWANISDPDLIIKHKNNSISVLLNDKYRKGKKIYWDGETEMNFFVTNYNDPNVLYNMFTVKLSKLIEEDFLLEINCPENFSVYTRRLFKKYIFINENN